MLQQVPVAALRSRLDNKIWMDEQVDQTMFSVKPSNLLFPKADRIIIENPENRVILRTSHRKLENLSDKKSITMQHPPRCGSRCPTFGTDMSKKKSKASNQSALR